MHKRAIFIITLLAACLSLTIGTGWAQTPEPPAPTGAARMVAQAAFGGHFKYGEWVTVWVTLENSGPDIDSDIRIAVTGSGGTMIFTTPAPLPSGARKRLPVYALPNNFSRQFIVELVSNDKVIASQRVALIPHPTVTLLIGLATPERGALSLLETVTIPGPTRPVELVDIQLDDIPDKFEGLRSFDILVFNNTDTSILRPEQSTTIESWVRQGGRLVVGGGAGGARTLAGLHDWLLPAANFPVINLSEVSGLADWIGGDRPIRVPGPFTITQIDLHDGRSLATQGDRSLLYEWDLDRGFVNLVSLDISGAPFDAWNGTTAFWEKLITPGAKFSENAPMDVSARQQFAANISYPLSNLPMLDLPSAGGLALLLGIYILLVGPINYLVLRRQKRLHLAWITIPVITLLFSGVSFGVGYALRGTNIFVNKIAILQLEPSGQANVTSFVGLFLPAQEGYEVQVRDASLLSPLGPFYDPWSSFSAVPPNTSGGRSINLVQGNPAYVRGLSVEQWSMQSFMAEGLQMDFGQIETDLRLEDNRLVGTVTNHSSHELKDVMLVLGNLSARLGALEAGGTAEVDMPMESSTLPNFGGSISYTIFEKELSGANGPAPREIEVRRAIIENIFERNPPYIASGNITNQAGLYQTPVLIGWLDQAPPDVSVTGVEPAQQTTAVLVMPTEYRIPEKGLISLPTGLVPGALVDNPDEGGSCGSTGVTGVYIVHGDALFDFYLPDALQTIQVDSLKLNLYSDGGAGVSPTVAFYDFKDNRWLLLKDANQGINMIPNDDRLIGPNGLIRVRLSAENAQSCFYISLGLEGSHK